MAAAEEAVPIVETAVEVGSEVVAETEGIVVEIGAVKEADEVAVLWAPSTLKPWMAHAMSITNLARKPGVVPTDSTARCETWRTPGPETTGTFLLKNEKLTSLVEY